jgi:ubiquinone/menaquinone biosynthesis C-methylase UbiE
MAAGYALSRPDVHRRVVEQAFRGLARTGPFPRALDIGCGAGVSTRALNGFAASSVGIEPVEAMLTWAARIAPWAGFVVGSAEAIPLRDRSVDLITAAGSLNYADLSRFFPEAARVLRPEGVLLVYDFSAGRTFRLDATLDEWFSEFQTRYPPPPYEARDLSPAILSDVSELFQVRGAQEFEIAIAMTRTFYVDYMMTETNVAAAVRRVVPAAEIKSWCNRTLVGLWDGAERQVLFRGYFACMAPVF